MRFCCTARIALLSGLTLVAPSVAQSQASGSLRAKISQLFILSSGDDPLFLGGSGDPNNPANIQAHGSHYIPSAVAANASLLGFINDAISASIGSIPIAATSGGVTFRFQGGIPVRTSTSAGPIFAERAQTLGRGRALIGLGRNSFHFSTLRGVPLDDINLIFTHENVDFPNCDALFSGDCSKMGVPAFENETIPIRVSLDLDVTVNSLYATYGVTDRLDVGVVVPVVYTNLHGQSFAQIIPFGGPPAVHFFAGTPTDPVLSSSQAVQGSAVGLGDVTMRMKYLVREMPHSSVALLGEARFGTGNPDDLLGTGRFSARGMAVISGRVESFSPHLNLGYAYRGHTSNAKTSDAVLATLGFDQLLSQQVTLAADVLSELQVGRSQLQLPGPVTYEEPYHRVIEPTTIPDIRDDLVTGSFGAKFALAHGFTAVGNALVPLNRGGMRPDIVYTTGLELEF
jgi:hypothetical protein